MIGAIAPLTDFSRWARGNFLVIVLLVLGAILLTRLADWLRGRITARIDAHARATDELVRSEAAKHRHVVAQVVTWTVLAVIYVITAVLIVERLGVPVAGLVARPAQDFDVAAALVAEPAVAAVVDGQPPAATALLAATAGVQDPQPTS